MRRRLPTGWQLLLISEESYTTFNPMLPEVVGEGVFPEHVVAPIREMLPGVRFVMGTVRSVDPAAPQPESIWQVMGWGSLLIPGGNDGLILLGLPLLWPYAWAGFLTMCLVIALALHAQQRWGA